MRRAFSTLGGGKKRVTAFPTEEPPKPAGLISPAPKKKTSFRMQEKSALTSDQPLKIFLPKPSIGTAATRREFAQNKPLSFKWLPIGQ
jgi:hypothetical protein